MQKEIMFLGPRPIADVAVIVKIPVRPVRALISHLRTFTCQNLHILNCYLIFYMQMSKMPFKATEVGVNVGHGAQ